MNTYTYYTIMFSLSFLFVLISINMFIKYQLILIEECINKILKDIINIVSLDNNSKKI